MSCRVDMQGESYYNALATGIDPWRSGKIKRYSHKFLLFSTLFRFMKHVNINPTASSTSFASATSFAQSLR